MRDSVVGLAEVHKDEVRRSRSEPICPSTTYMQSLAALPFIFGNLHPFSSRALLESSMFSKASM